MKIFFRMKAALNKGLNGINAEGFACKKTALILVHER